MGLKQEDERLLEKRGIDLWDVGPDNAYRQKMEGKFPARAIVKELIDQYSGVDAKNVGKILKNIRCLNGLKIYNRDIRSDNFSHGLLLDFGSAWTEPNCILNALDRGDAEEWKRVDLVMFDDMVEDEGIRTYVRALPNADYCIKLRSWNR
jgi:hypothetical protein